jgi:transposase
VDVPDLLEPNSDLHAEMQCLQVRIEKAETERDQYRRLYQQMLETCRKLERGLLGQKAERLPEDDAQLTLQLLATLLGERELPVPERVQQVPAHERRKPTGRKPLPENLPRVEIEILPEEVKQAGLDAFERIGEEVSEVAEYRPKSAVVVRTVRPKFVRKDRRRNGSTRISVAPPPELPIERGVAGPGLLADTIVRRWQDHLPLHRLEGIYARDGLELARSTLCGWHEQLRDLVHPLVEAMWEDAFASPYLCTDATGVLVQAKNRCRRGHFWVVIAPERHVLYRYSAKHNGKAVDAMLSGYEGYLVADAHAVYDHLYADGRVTEVGCWAHGRRYFFKALSSDPERARQALAFIQGMFAIERAHTTAPRKKRHAIRQKESKPLVEGFFDWCDAQVDTVLDDTPIAQAVQYVRNQRRALERFLDDGRLPMHNNDSERALRRQAVGRKNWLFVGSDQAADVNATFVSLLASCQLHEIEPWSYLRDLFCVLPSWRKSRVLELSPACWRQTLEQDDTQQRLEANPYRQVTVRESD